ncbi:zinc finger MYND domain-containing protein [Sporobolomyces koalae]|uniref:zinc finger MYND domain-containing protein n=1 Tax=Sporobolomyces koalae TaxID=500713 RepID=UPI003181D017
MTTSVSSNGIRLLHRVDGSTVALCKTGDSFELRTIGSSNNESVSDLDAVTTVSIMADADPFPGFTTSGQQMIWLKDYGGNSGLLKQLERARFVQSVGRTIKQGFVTLPLCIVLLDDRETMHSCQCCKRTEALGALDQRFKRCAKCRRRYYCSPEHQLADWPQHKADCRDLIKLDFVSVENLRRQRQELELEDRGAMATRTKIVEVE